MAQQPQQQAVMECLEERSLFSVAPVLAHPAAPQSAALVQSKTIAKKKKPPKFSLVGEWDGRYTVKAFPFKLKYDLDLDVRQVNPANFIGTLSIDDRDYHGRWAGYTFGNGTFSYTLKDHGNHITISGGLNAKSNFSSGGIKIDWGFFGSKGDFTLTRISK